MVSFPYMFLCTIILIFLNLERTHTHSHQHIDNHSRSVNIDKEEIRRRLSHLSTNANISILVNMHIPKAGGTALALALSSSCDCNQSRSSLPICRDCPLVKGRHPKPGYPNKYKYVSSRVTGWPCKGHAPLAVTEFIPSCRPDGEKLSDFGLYPVYIIMLRDPYQRYISEAQHWCGVKVGNCLDWSIINENKEILRSKRLQSMNISADSLEKMTDRLSGYSYLPASLLLHNRQVKMVGGSFQDFNMQFDQLKDLGSRFIGKPYNPTSLLSRSLHILSTRQDILVLIHERFAESLCLLEIIFGHLYPFHWDPEKHSHHWDPKSGTRTASIDLEYRYSLASNNASDLAGRSKKEVFESWFQRNKEDLLLYNASKKLFDLYLSTAIESLQQRGNDIKSLKGIPHCKGFV